MRKLELTFFPVIPGIDVQEHRYWRKTFDKLLKIGVELEFNLRLKKGTCIGFNTDCICKHIEECSPVPCVFQTVNSDVGPVCNLYPKQPNLKVCADKKCNYNCDKCDQAEPRPCLGQNCIQYTPICVQCDNNTVDCVHCNDYIKNGGKSNEVRQELAETLKATESFGVVGPTGVLQVVKDGSLTHGGLEIPTVGRRFDFKTFVDMLRVIMSRARDAGGYFDERCSTHVHILTEYYTKVSNQNGQYRHPDENASFNISGLERNIPDIILKNIVQIWKQHEVAIFWMSCGLAEAEHMTRWGKFRCPIMDISIVHDLSDILGQVEAITGKSKYASLNIRNTKFDGSRLHLEFRTMDAVNSPTYITAMCAIFQAIILRAVDISVGGLLDVKPSDKKRRLLEILVNGIGRGYDGARTSNTASVFEFQADYINLANEFIDFITPTLPVTRQEMAVIRKIAEKPPAMYLMAAGGKDPINMYEIERIYSSCIEPNPEVVDDEEMLEFINKAVSINMVHDCKSITEWKQSVFEDSPIDTDFETFSRYINKLIQTKRIVWDRNLKSMKGI